MLEYMEICVFPSNNAKTKKHTQKAYDVPLIFKENANILNFPCKNRGALKKSNFQKNCALILFNLRAPGELQGGILTNPWGPIKDTFTD